MADTQKGIKSTENNSKTEAKILINIELACSELVESVERRNTITLSYFEASFEARPV